MGFRSYALLCVLFLCDFIIFGQQGQKEDIIQQRIEFISEQLQSESIDLTNLFDQLNFYYENPINLNKTNKEELTDLLLLSDVQITDLLLHIKAHGRLISIYELQGLKYWDIATIRTILPFVMVDDKLDNIHISWKEALKQGKFELYLRYQPTLQAKAGYENVPDSILNTSNKYYLGNSDKYYTRFRYTYKTNISIGVTAEKDAGEQFFRGVQKNGFDFYSGHLFYKGGKYLKSFVLGDYQIQLGQGLNMWSSYAFGKTSDISTMKRNAIPIRPYTSVDESRFLRGGAILLNYGHFSNLTFASSKKIDANILSDSTLDNLEFISTIDLSGLHRTNSEIARMNGFRETQFGNSLRYNGLAFECGLNFVYQGYDKPLEKGIRPYELYDFSGRHNFVGSFDYSGQYRNWTFFGEAARNYSPTEDTLTNGGWASVQGVFLSLNTFASIGLLHRNYSKKYHSFYNAGFSEGSSTANENGTYSGLKIKLSRNFNVVGYTDVFIFPWMKYLVDAPSKGYEYLFQVNYKPSKTLQLYARFKEQSRERNSRLGDGSVTEIEAVNQRNYRLNLSYTLNEFFTFKSRIENVQIERESSNLEQGLIFTQDLLYKPKSSPIDLTLRYAIFNTDSYDTRIYSFENNALYVFAVPAYYYRGSRAYALIRYTFRNMDIWARYGVFIYDNRSSLGSGLEEIKGAVKSDLTVQVRLSF